jgi:hypothetical protein
VPVLVIQEDFALCCRRETSTIDGQGLYVSTTFKMLTGVRATATPFLSFADFKQHLDKILTDVNPEIIEYLDLSESKLFNDDVPILTSQGPARLRP